MAGATRIENIADLLRGLTTLKTLIGTTPVDVRGADRLF
jgi:hypothetical protein